MGLRMKSDSEPRRRSRRVETRTVELRIESDSEPALPSHELSDFWASVEARLESQYKSIKRRVLEHAGTSGERAEDSWAKLLRECLPQAYQVVTRGRIIDEAGRTSPEIDILVLRPEYPGFLLDEKYHLAAGVAAAFECKLTLHERDFEKAFANGKTVKNLAHTETGTPHRELNRPIMCGVLAHDHSWHARSGSREVKWLEETGKIEQLLLSSQALVDEPYELTDLVCVASAATFVLRKKLFINPHASEVGRSMFKGFDSRGGVGTAYDMYSSGYPPAVVGHTMGAFIAFVYKLLARQEANLRPLSRYFSREVFTGPGVGLYRVWPSDVLSRKVLDQIQKRGYDSEEWSEWGESH
jgi:hypothetical protein